MNSNSEWAIKYKARKAKVLQLREDNKKSIEALLGRRLSDVSLLINTRMSNAPKTSTPRKA